LRDREFNHVFLNTFLNEQKWNIEDGGLKPEVDMAKHGTYIYIVRLFWKETGSAKSKMAAYTHEMRIFQLPD